MLASRFDTSIVLSDRDLLRFPREADPFAVMDAVEDAIAGIPGAADIEICFLGTREPQGPRVAVRRHGANGKDADLGAAARIITHQIEQRARRAIARLAPRAA